MTEPEKYPPSQYPPSGGGGAYPGNQNVPYPPPSYVPPNYQYQILKPFSTYAILSMIMGGAGILMAPLGALSGPLGILFGWLGMRECREQDGTHRGRGLAISGLLVSVLSALLSIGLIVLIVWLFMFIDEQSEQHSVFGQLQTIQHEADEDLYLIEERLRQYYVENLRTFEPGGPKVVDGRHGNKAIAELPKVEGELKMSDLVDSIELNNSPTDYTLRILGTHQAQVTCRAASRQLKVDYTTSRDYEVDGIR